MDENVGIDMEIIHRVSATWGNWKKCSGVLCDGNMPVMLKREIYRIQVKPSLLYGAE